MSERVNKDAMACNKPRRTPGHPTKSHVVKACYDGKEKVIRFGEQGASTAGKPKEGESERMKTKRASFKARHAKNIAKGPSSPAYWANKVKWAEGGEVKMARGGNAAMALLEQMRRTGQSPEFDAVAVSMREQRNRPRQRPPAPQQARVPQAAPQPREAPLPLPPIPPSMRPDENPPPEAPRNPMRFDEGNPHVATAIQMAQKYGLPTNVFLSLVQQESRFDPNARSSRGAIGLGQLMPGTARELGVDPTDPVQNLEGSARYLRQMLDRFGDMPLALAAYNAGPGTVRRAGNTIPNIRETQQYVPSILRRAGANVPEGLADLEQKYAEGGAVMSDEEYDRRLLSRMKAQTGRVTEPTRAEQMQALRAAGSEAAQLAADVLLPQSPLDAALMVALGPGGRAARLAGAGALATLEPSEAEASRLSQVADIFYRGVPRLHGRVGEVSGLHMRERGAAQPSNPYLKANTRDYAWASDNPAVASSYTHFGGAVIPLELAERPGAILDAKGAPWNEYFFKPGSRSARGAAPDLTPEFREALEDPAVKSILVNNILDFGLESQKPGFLDWLSNRVYGRPYNSLSPREEMMLTREGLVGNNLLIKDPSVVRYRYTGEPAEFSQGGLADLEQKYAEGGEVSVAQYNADAVDALVKQIEAEYV